MDVAKQADRGLELAVGCWDRLSHIRRWSGFGVYYHGRTGCLLCKFSEPMNCLSCCVGLDLFSMSVASDHVGRVKTS